MSLRNDEPTLVDWLGRYPLVKEVGDTIKTCAPPHVVGIHGDWGSGKTSFMHQLHWYLIGECPQQPELPKTSPAVAWEGWKPAGNVTVVWFEAWRYQNELVPVVALLQEIRTQLPWYSKTISSAKKLTTVAVRSALMSLEDLTKKIGIQASVIQREGEKYEADFLSTALPSHTMRAHLTAALRTLVGKSGRVVVLVDDLDRCESDAAYKLLEGIKIYLNLENCVFVLGMNQRVIEAAISRQFSGNDPHRAREYIEKLCQNIYHLPLIQDPASLLKKYLGDFDASDAICQIVGRYRCIPANARKIKGFANLLPRFTKRIPREGTDAERERQGKICLVLAYIYQFHQDIYRLLEWHPNFYQELSRWARGLDVSHSVFADKAIERALVSSGADLKEATHRPKLQDAFVDPALGNVLRVQSLINDLGPDVTQTEIERYTEGRANA